MSTALIGSGFFTVEPVRTMQADGYPWEHEIRVALPISYLSDSEQAYPVLWVTDNALETALAVLGPRELIVVSVGAPLAAGEIRRGYDFFAQEELERNGPVGDFVREMIRSRGITPQGGGGAPQFLDFLVDDLRPALAAEYRMQPDDHALAGYSAGGWFVMYALFTRPGAFAKYIAGAPALYMCQDLIFELEQQFAASHDDLPGQLFLGAGDGEMTNDWHIGCFSSMARMAETLSLRAYPSLVLTVQVIQGESHATAAPFVLGEAVRALWDERPPMQAEGREQRLPAPSRLLPPEAVLRTGAFRVEPPRTMQSDGYPWEHEIRIALPLSYTAEPQKSYPVLWVTDNALELAISVLGARELIVVSVGTTRGVTADRRSHDFFPREDVQPVGPIGDFLRTQAAANDDVPRGGGADRFLQFLVDEVRPALAAEYRMRPDDHALEGYSAGGWFVTYAMFSRPDAFAKYIAGAPPLYHCQDLIWELEARFAATHRDLPVDLFLGTGEGEMTVDPYGCFSSMAKLVEMLSFRDYPSLRMTVRTFPGQSHATGRPFVISNAVQSLWGDEIWMEGLAIRPRRSVG